MNIQTVLSIVAAGMLMTAVANAQENATVSSDPNEIFNSIMQTMPDAMKNRVDSASATQRMRNEPQMTTQPSFNKVREPSAAVDAKQASLDKLPESVREQVRKTMKELEQGTIERMLQFKEAQNQEKVK
jgi:hypothetical protein